MFEINDESGGTYDIDNQIRYKTSMLRSSLCDYSDKYILAKEIITVTNTIVQGGAVNNRNKKAIFKNHLSFTSCISTTNNMRVDDAQDIDVVMQMYDLIEYSDNYLKTSGISWQYCSDEPAINAANGNITYFTVANSITDSFKNKQKITGKTENNCTKNGKIMVPLKYLSIFIFGDLLKYLYLIVKSILV